MLGSGVFERNISHSPLSSGGKALEKSHRSPMGAWLSLVADRSYGLIGTAWGQLSVNLLRISAQGPAEIQISVG